MADVSVSDEDGKPLYDIEKLYINRLFDDISIEFSGKIEEEELI